jgi:hypothetical protein
MTKDHEFVATELIKMEPQGLCWRTLSKHSGVAYGTIATIARRTTKNPGCETIESLKNAIIELNFSTKE